MRKILFIFLLFSSIVRAQFIINPYAFTVPYTTRTQAFATATGITDPTILGALNTFDLGLIANGLDTKAYAIYPMVGGTSSTTKYNFMDAQDTDGAYRITWNGGITYASTGVTGNGTTGYGNTHLNPNTVLTINNSCIGFCSRTNVLEAACDFGSYDGANNGSGIWSRFTGNLFYGDIDRTQGSVSYSNSNSIGLFVSDRSASNDFRQFISGSKVNQTTTASTSKSNYNLYLFARDDSGTANFFSTKECDFAFIMQSLTDAEHLILYNLINDFNTTLGR